MTIENYLLDLPNIQSRYNRHWKNPYSTAYTRAHARFKAQLNQQATLDKMKAEILLMVSTVAIGGAMSTLFGTAILRSVAVDQALNIVCRNNMNRALHVMGWIESNAAAKFIAESVWDQAAVYLQNRTKQRVEGLLSRPAAGLSGIAEPTEFRNTLDNYVLGVKIAAHDVASDIRDNPSVTSTQKDEIARGLRAAPFFANAPTTSLIRDSIRVEKELELLLYMILVMNSDYIVEMTTTAIGRRVEHDSRRIGPVTQRATGNNYPRRTSQRSSGFGYSRTTIRGVGYDRPGGLFWSAIMDRTNELHRNLFNTDFEQGSYGRDEIARAERLSQRIQQNHLSRPQSRPRR